MNKPVLAVALNLARMFALSVPLAVIGGRTAGLTGLFIGLAWPRFWPGSYQW
jgi:hypothetical protein